MVPGRTAGRTGRYAGPMSDRPTASPQVQIFGHDGDPATRAALRFFKERRVAIHLVDLRRRPIAPGELRRFVERLGAGALLDREGRAFREAGRAYLSMDEAGIAERLLAEPRLLRLPLIRFGNEVTAGRAEAAWRAWLRPGG